MFFNEDNSFDKEIFNNKVITRVVFKFWWNDKFLNGIMKYQQELFLNAILICGIIVIIK